MTSEDDGSEHVATCPLYLFNKSHWGDFTSMQTADDEHRVYERATIFEGELWNYAKAPEGMTFYEERQKKEHVKFLKHSVEVGLHKDRERIAKSILENGETSTQ